MADPINYQVQAGFSVKGSPSGSILELGPSEPETTDLVNMGALSDVIDPLLVPPPPSAFSDLRSRIEETAVFGKVYATSKVSQPVMAAYALVMNAIDNRRIRNLAFSIEDLATEMANTGAGFTAAEITEINGWLDDCGFLFRLTET